MRDHSSLAVCHLDCRTFLIQPDPCWILRGKRTEFRGVLCEYSQPHGLDQLWLSQSFRGHWHVAFRPNRAMLRVTGTGEAIVRWLRVSTPIPHRVAARRADIEGVVLAYEATIVALEFTLHSTICRSGYSQHFWCRRHGIGFRVNRQTRRPSNQNSNNDTHHPLHLEPSFRSRRTFQRLIAARSADVAINVEGR